MWLKALHAESRKNKSLCYFRQLLLRHPIKGFELDTFGRYLSSLKPSKEFPSLKVAILATSSSQPLANAIRVEILKEGFFGEIYEAPFGALQQEIFNKQSGLYSFNPDLILLSFDFEKLEKIPKRPLKKRTIDSFISDNKKTFNQIWKYLTQNLKGQILQNAFVPPAYLLANPGERLEPWAYFNFVEKLNYCLRKTKSAKVFWIDVDRLACSVGLDNWHDPRFFHQSSYPFALQFLPNYGNLFGATLREIIGRAPKALIVDLDDTLWGGVVADDGLDGIKLGPDTPEGAAFTNFCKYLKLLNERGIILGICSKNELKNAIQVFENHQHMPLKWSDFSVCRCNWNSKEKNLIEISKELNIDPSAIVFADNNPAECELIRQKLPMVKVVELNDDPALFIKKIDNNYFFHKQCFFHEDLVRLKSYKSSKEIKLNKNQKNLTKFLKSLQMTGKVKIAEQNEFPRLAELESKTNQFNLSTRRLKITELKNLKTKKNVFIVSGYLKDRFANHGLISYCIAQKNCKKLTIEDFLMSCRVFSRTFEFFFLKKLLKIVDSTKINRIKFNFRSTQKNNPIKLFLKSCGINRKNKFETRVENLKKKLVTYIK